MHGLKRDVLAASMLVLASAGALAQSAQKAPPPTEAALLAKGGRVLPGADIRAMYVGNTLTGTSAEGDGFDVYVASQTHYRMRFQGKVTEERWTVGQNGEFCAMTEGTTVCTREVLADQIIYSFNADGTLAGTAKLRAGNPEGL